MNYLVIFTSYLYLSFKDINLICVSDKSYTDILIDKINNLPKKFMNYIFYHTSISNSKYSYSILKSYSKNKLFMINLSKLQESKNNKLQNNKLQNNKLQNNKFKNNLKGKNTNQEKVKINIENKSEKLSNSPNMIFTISVNTNILNEIVNKGLTIKYRKILFSLLKKQIKTQKLIHIIETIKKQANKTTKPRKSKRLTFKKSNFLCKNSLNLFSNNFHNKLKWIYGLENKTMTEFNYLNPFYYRIGDIYIDLEKRRFSNINISKINNVKFKGGIILEDSGNSSELLFSSYLLYDKKNIVYKSVWQNKKIKCNSSLVIVKQGKMNRWISLLNNVNKSVEKIKYLVFKSKSDLEKVKYNDIIQSDIVIITDTLFYQTYYLSKFTSYIDDWNNLEDCFDTIGMEFMRNNKIIDNTFPILQIFNWKRIIYDNVILDMLRTNMDNNKLELYIKLSSKYVWCVENLENINDIFGKTKKKVFKTDMTDLIYFKCLLNLVSDGKIILESEKLIRYIKYIPQHFLCYFNRIVL